MENIEIIKNVSFNRRSPFITFQLAANTRFPPFFRANIVAGGATMDRCLLVPQLSAENFENKLAG